MTKLANSPSFVSKIAPWVLISSLPTGNRRPYFGGIKSKTVFLPLSSAAVVITPVGLFNTIYVYVSCFFDTSFPSIVIFTSIGNFIPS